MDKIRAYALLEQNKDLFIPNKKYSDLQIEDALIAAPDSFESVWRSTRFFNPSTTELLALLTIGGDRLYLRDFKGALLKILTLGGLGIWYAKDKKTAENRCRIKNCEILLQKLNEHK